MASSSLNPGGPSHRSSAGAIHSTCFTWGLDLSDSTYALTSSPGDAGRVAGGLVGRGIDGGVGRGSWRRFFRAEDPPVRGVEPGAMWTRAGVVPPLAVPLADVSVTVLSRGVVHATRGADTSARAACGAPGPAQLSANRFETTTGRRVLSQAFELFARTKRKFRTRLTNYTLNYPIRLYVSWVILSLTERLLLFSFVGHVRSIFIVERGVPGENADRPRPRPCRRSTSATTGSA